MYGVVLIISLVLVVALVLVFVVALGVGVNNTEELMIGVASCMVVSFLLE